MRRALAALNLAVLALLPVAWTAPLARAGLHPLLGMEAVSVLSALGALWPGEWALALLVGVLAVAAPVAKVAALAVALGRGRPAAGALHWLGKLAMTDVFLVAVAIVAAKGVGFGRVETAWGLWFYAALVLGHMALVALARRVAGG